MRIGKYFRIPEGPVDIESLWRDAQPVAGTQRPVWLSAEDAPGYRLVGTASWPHPPVAEKENYFEEILALRSAGIVVEQAPNGLCDHRFYLRAPTGAWNNDAVFSIGMYEGESPFALQPASNLRNPILTHRDVSDIPASFVADPFMMLVEGTWYLFFEAMHAKSGKGEIGVATSSDTRNWTYKQIVLAEPFHLSYPYVFAAEGEFYMMPESYQAGEVRLYRAENFPTDWRYAQPILKIPFVVDSSIFQHEGHWWLFADTSVDMNNETLRLYESKDLTGPWREHLQSPIVKANAHLARPSGRVLVSEGQIYRFAQSCLPYYGTCVRAFEITKLSPAAYEEREVQSSPILQGTGKGWNSCGMHHIDAHQQPEGKWLACVDGWTSDTVLNQMQG